MRTFLDITDSPFLGRVPDHFPQPKAVLNCTSLLAVEPIMAAGSLSSTFRQVRLGLPRKGRWSNILYLSRVEDGNSG
jgi:hypothetical protein